MSALIDTQVQIGLWRKRQLALKEEHVQLLAGMELLIDQCQLPSVGLYLQLNTRKAGNALLRWRFKRGGKHQYLSFKQVREKIFPYLTPAMCQHYEVMNKKVIETNNVSAMLQSQITQIGTMLTDLKN